MKRWTPPAVAALDAFVILVYRPSRTPVLHAQTGAPSARTAIRITFGEQQDHVTDYSGTVTLSEGRVVELIPWRFFGDDQLQGENGWKITTRRGNFENQPDRPVPLSTPGGV